jgi:hypothetical protein
MSAKTVVGLLELGLDIGRRHSLELLVGDAADVEELVLLLNEHGINRRLHPALEVGLEHVGRELAARLDNGRRDRTDAGRGHHRDRAVDREVGYSTHRRGVTLGFDSGALVIRERLHQGLFLRRDRLVTGREAGIRGGYRGTGET